MRIDESGHAQPTGEFETLKADTLVLALGQDADSGFLKKIPEIAFDRDGCVVVAPNMMTGRAGIFAGGDMVPTERSVTVATGHGKKAARHIDAWLRGEIYTRPAKHSAIEFAGLNLPIYALHEAKRCLSCGNCFECDNCFAACPEDAIIKLGPNEGYEIKLDLCTGCGICVEQCPCHAMEMVSEPTGVRT
jgi:formate dehydrogenase beta subunit